MIQVPFCPYIAEVAHQRRQVASSPAISLVHDSVAATESESERKEESDAEFGKVLRPLCFANCSRRRYSSEAGPFAN